MKSKFPQRIACLTSETTELVYALGAGDRVVGVSGFSTRPAEAREKPKVSTFTTLNMEKIHELQPDLVLGFSDLQKDMARELIAEGYPVFISNQRSLEEIADTLVATGRLIGCTEEGEKLRKSFLDEIARLAALRQGKAKPRVYFEEWDDPLISGILWVSELIEKLGAQDIFSHRSLNKNAKDRNVKPEEVIAANPDILVASWCGKKVNFEKIREREGWREIAAVRENRLHEIKSSDILVPGLSLLHGARQLSQIL